MEEEIAVKIQTKAVHAGDRKKPGSAVPTATPISTATAFTYDTMEELDRIFGREKAFSDPEGSHATTRSAQHRLPGLISSVVRKFGTNPARPASPATWHLLQ